jgi:hypothetical protein
LFLINKKDIIEYIASIGLLTDNHPLGSGQKKNVEEVLFLVKNSLLYGKV